MLRRPRPSGSSSIRRDYVPKGSAVNVELSFSGLEYNSDASTTDYTFRADVSNWNDPDAAGCDGSGLGEDTVMKVVDQDPETRTATISSSCPEGEYILVVNISSPGGAVLASAIADFSVKRVQQDDLAADNTSPMGHWVTWPANKTKVYVTDVADNKVYVYEREIYDKTLTHLSSETITLDDTNTSPQGIWSDGETFWVANDGTGANDKIFAYTLATGEPDPDKDIDTLQAAGNTSPAGIWSSNHQTLLVADDEDDKIYAYDIKTKARVTNSAGDAYPDDYDTLQRRGQHESHRHLGQRPDDVGGGR